MCGLVFALVLERSGGFAVAYTGSTPCRMPGYEASGSSLVCSGDTASLCRYTGKSERFFLIVVGGLLYHYVGGFTGLDNFY